VICILALLFVPLVSFRTYTQKEQVSSFGLLPATDYYTVAYDTVVV